MQTMNVALPDSLTKYVEQQIVRHGYASASDYIRELVQADQRKKDRQALEAEVLRAIECNEFVPLTDEVWNQMRETLNERLRAKQETHS